MGRLGQACQQPVNHLNLSYQYIDNTTQHNTTQHNTTLSFMKQSLYYKMQKSAGPLSISLFWIIRNCKISGLPTSILEIILNLISDFNMGMFSTLQVETMNLKRVISIIFVETDREGREPGRHSCL